MEIMFSFAVSRQSQTLSAKHYVFGSVLGIPSYYNTPEFLYPDAPHNIINKHPTIEAEEQHDKEIKLEKAAKQETKDKHTDEHTTNPNDEHSLRATEESQHYDLKSSESHEMKAKKSSLPEFTANRDTMLLEVSANSYLMLLQHEK